MKDMEMLQGKFIMLAEKLGVNDSIVAQIKEDFGKGDDYHTMPDGSMMKNSDMPEGEVKVTKVEIKGPDLESMEKEELIALIKKMKNKGEMSDHEEKPNKLMVMLKKKHY